VAIGTVQGDLHDIGKNLVAMMLEGSGFEIMDLGVDVPLRGSSRPSVKVPTWWRCPPCSRHDDQHARDHPGHNGRGLRDQASIVIGGAPITKTMRRDRGGRLCHRRLRCRRVVREVLAA